MGEECFCSYVANLDPQSKGLNSIGQLMNSAFAMIIEILLTYEILMVP